MRPLAAMAGVDLPLRVTREQVTYVRSVPTPTTIIVDWDEPVCYLVPVAFGAPGIKVGIHHGGVEIDPDDGPFPPSPEISRAALDRAKSLIGDDAEIVAAETCLYTNTADEDFIVRRHGPVVIVSACSGHGFKFAPRIGRVVADLVEDEPLAAPPRLRQLWSSSA